MNDQKNPPVAKKQFDRVQAAIWAHETEDENGTRIDHSVLFSRSYKDKKGNEEKWETSHYWSTRDLPHLKLATEWAMKELLMKGE